MITGISTLELTIAYNTITTDSIENLPERVNELILEFGSELIKTDFFVDQDFMREHGLELYKQLSDSKELEANYEDFQAIWLEGL